MYVIKDKSDFLYLKINDNFLYLKEISLYGMAIWQSLQEAKTFYSEAAAIEYLKNRKIRDEWIHTYCAIQYIHPLNIK